jgi:uncharacterized damage-inducible protein DinB
MTRDEALELLRYDDWATARLLAVAARLSPAHYGQAVGGVGSLREALVRLVSARVTWLARWTGRPAGVGLFAAAYPDVPRLRERWAAVSAGIGAHFAAVDDAALAAPLAYWTRNGLEVTLPLGRTVQHVVHQGTAWRGQAALLLRQLGERGVHLDLATFLRERARAAGR